MCEGVSQCECVVVCEGVSQYVRVCPSVGGCAPVWEGVPQSRRVCLSEVCAHTVYMHACQVSNYIYMFTTHDNLYCTKPHTAHMQCTCTCSDQASRKLGARFLKKFQHDY